MVAIGNYGVSFYGCGCHEYEDYCKVIVYELDEYSIPIKRKKTIYVKAESMKEVQEFINFLICESGYTIDLFANCEKIHINKRIIWEVHSNESK